MYLSRAVAVVAAAGMYLTFLLVSNTTSSGGGGGTHSGLTALLVRDDRYHLKAQPSIPADTSVIVQPGTTSGQDGAEDVLRRVVFAVVGSRRPRQRRPFVDLWWRPNHTRGLMWLDQSSSSPKDDDHSTVAVTPTPLQSRVLDSTVPVPLQLGRIVLETFDADDGGPEPWWVVVGDDDTVFFPENLATVLAKYDHRRYWYVGGNSESAPQSAKYYGIAFGGGGYALSSGLIKALRPILNREKGGCLERYWKFRILDQIIYSCIAELGVAVTHEAGFHQLDLRGDISGFLSAHPQAPLISLHHVDLVDPIFPTAASRVDALSRLMTAAASDPSRILQQSFCYDRPRNRTYSVAFGYSVHAYGPEQGLLPPSVLHVPFRTFKPWKPWGRPAFSFDVRPVPVNGSCDGPDVFYFQSVPATHLGDHDIVTTYVRHSDAADGSGDGGGGGLTSRPAKCGAHTDSFPVGGVQRIRVVSPAKRLEWPGSRRDCCDIINNPSRADEIELRLRSCREGEPLY